jgi:hypothetical protein
MATWFTGQKSIVLKKTTNLIYFRCIKDGHDVSLKIIHSFYCDKGVLTIDKILFELN